MLRYVLPVAILSGTIIGAGVFALPYLFAKSGVLMGAAYLAAFAAVFGLLHLMYADVMLRTDGGAHDLLTYAGRHLGRWGRAAALPAGAGGIALALAAYLALMPGFSRVALPHADGGLVLALFWAFGTAGALSSFRKVAALEFISTVAMAAIVGALAFSGLSRGASLSAFPLFDWRSALLPFGAVLFSYAGRAAVPEVIGYLKQERLPLLAARPVILWGTAIPGLVYALFIMGVLGASFAVSPDAVSGLEGMPPIVLRGLGWLGILALFTSYVVLGANFSRILARDIGFTNTVSGTLGAIVPPALYLLGLNNFLVLVGVAGGVFLGAESVLVLLMWRAANREGLAPLLLSRAYGRLVLPLAALFTAGAVYEIIRIIADSK